MGILFLLILLWAIYTLYTYFITANYKAIVVAVIVYLLLSFLIKSKTTVLFLTIIFTNCFILCTIFSRIFLLTKTFTNKIA
jgi:hypothetical protein